jgi:hypothetical protein
MISTALDCPDMAKEQHGKSVQQMGLRLNKQQLDRLRAYANAHPMQPSLTTLIDMAIGEWLANHESEIAPPRPASAAKR